MIQYSESRERVLDAAERLFAERGYGTVTIKDIAKIAGIHHASLYHHAPGGKEQLFIEVTERNILRHKQGIEAAIEAAGNDLRAQLQGIAAWLLSQPPMDLIRLVHSDMPAIPPEAAARLSQMVFESMLLPIWTILKQAAERGDIEHPHLANIGGAILSSIESLHTVPDEFVQGSRLDMAAEVIDIFIRGMAKSTG